MPNRHGSSTAYRYGFNTQEKVDEISGEGNHYTAKFWEYDTRTATRWNPDPDGLSFWSPYAVNYGMPIKFSDPDGDCPWVLVGAFVGGMLLSTQTAVAPTGNWKVDGPRIRESNEDQGIGLLTMGLAPGVGRVANKLLKPLLKKAAPILTKVTSKITLKKAEEKGVGVVEKKLVEKFGQQAGEEIVEKAEEKTISVVGRSGDIDNLKNVVLNEANPGGLSRLSNNPGWNHLKDKYAHITDGTKRWAKINNEWWYRYNRPWLDNITKRGDKIKNVSKTIEENLINEDGSPTHFAREIKYLTQKGYKLVGEYWVKKKG